MDSDIGVGKNWSRDSADRWVKFWRNCWERMWHVSMSMLMGSRKASSRACCSGVEAIVTERRADAVVLVSAGCAQKRSVGLLVKLQG